MNQEDMFEPLKNDPLHQPNAPDLYMGIDIIQIVHQIIRNTGMSRDQFVERMNLTLRNAPKKVSTRQLNHWLSPSQSNVIPAEVLPAIAWAGGSIAAFNRLLQPLHYKSIDARADEYRALSELEIEVATKQQLANAKRNQLLRAQEQELEIAAQRMVQSGASE